MLVPALITVGILGTLYLTRETEPAPSALDADMARYGQIIAAGRAAEIDPGQLDALAAHLRKGNRTAEAATVEAWAAYVRAIKRGVQPPPLPPGLPGVGPFPALPVRGTGPTPNPVGPLPVPADRPTQLDSVIATRAAQLLAQGEAASPFALEQLAGEIERVAPGSDIVLRLRNQARANRALMNPPVQGAAPPWSVMGHDGGAGLRPMQSAPVDMARFNVGTMRVPFSNAGLPFLPYSGLAAPVRRSGAMRCTAQAGCSLMKTPGSLYPTGVTVPFMTAVNVQEEQGDWLHVLYGTQRGWVPKTEFSTDLQPGGPFAVPVATAR